MLNINDLWIGERLRMKSGGRTGTFEGAASGSKVRFKTGEKMLLIDISELELAPDEEQYAHKPLWDEEPSRKKASRISEASSIIDLHIETLSPELVHARPEQILIRQRAAFRQFMQQAIESGLPRVTIIHGKGEGVLREEVRFLLSRTYHARHIVQANDDGSTEAWL